MKKYIILHKNNIMDYNTAFDTFDLFSYFFPVYGGDKYGHFLYDVQPKEISKFDKISNRIIKRMNEKI